ncbi:MAG TPA: glycoside hydrolase family 9 protein, partial [Chitinispirillaceae bacterium]|nr:glycoside hydrolase family 9 protein [Chitinispirillaceae bacterium]
DGGWYDAGDYIKFGMNSSYSVYCLLKGYDVFPTAYEDSYKWDHSSGGDGIPDILNQVKFKTDFFIKAVIDENTIVLDVGKGHEHSDWSRATNPGRSAGDIVLCNGADIPATYAACLALMSVLYREFDESYADSCLEKAKTAFNYAKQKVSQGGDNNLFCSPQGEYYDYYKVDGQYQRNINDRMVAAGVELYRATNDENPEYRSWARKSIPDQYNCIGFGFIGPLASFEVWRQGLGAATTLSNNVTFINNNRKTSGVYKDIYQNSGWGTARDAGSAAFEYALAYVITSSEETRNTHLQRAKDHVNWVTGANGGQSYVCGVNGGPTSIHYRTTNYGAIPGAVVAGPDDQGNWQDDGARYEYTEVAIDYNAGITGAVAFLKAIDDPGSAVTISSNFGADPSLDIDFTSQNVKFSTGFSKSIPWKIEIGGEFGKKTISGNSSSINETWNGDADQGFFLSGEILNARLIIEGDIAAYDLVKVKPISLTVANAKKVEAKSGDVLIDDFEDKNSENKLGGTWVAEGSGKGLTATTISYTSEEESNVLKLNARVNANDKSTFSSARTTFNSDNTPCSIGPSKSIYFDLKGNDIANVYVELEQATVTDSAYHFVMVPVTKSFNTYRIDISDFRQPDDATSSQELDLNNLSALRFTIYDSVSTFSLFIDNVKIEDLQVSSTTISPVKLVSNYLKPAISNNKLEYSIPRNLDGIVECVIYNVAGRSVLKRTLSSNSGKVSIPLSNLPSGFYTVIHSVNGKILSQKLKFTNIY